MWVVFCVLFVADSIVCRAKNLQHIFKSCVLFVLIQCVFFIFVFPDWVLNGILLGELEKEEDGYVAVSTL